MMTIIKAVLAGIKHLLAGAAAAAALFAAYAIAGADGGPPVATDDEPAIVLTPPIQEQLDALCAAAWPDDDRHALARQRACAKD